MEAYSYNGKQLAKDGYGGSNSNYDLPPGGGKFDLFLITNSYSKSCFRIARDSERRGDKRYQGRDLYRVGNYGP